MKKQLEIPDSLRNIWPSDLILMMGLWLIERKEYGHGLLCIHGASLGMKIGDQLELKWKHVMDDGHIGSLVKYDDGKMKKRIVNEFFSEITEKVYRILKVKNEIQTPLYLNSKTGKPLTTSTLNRELAKFSKEFLLDLYVKTGFTLVMKELKSNAFEIAWGRDMVRKYMLTKKVFQEVNRYMGHRQMSDTYEILGLEPNDEIVFDFNKCFPSYDYDSFGLLLNDKRKLKRAIAQMNLLFIGGEDTSHIPIE